MPCHAIKSWQSHSRPQHLILHGARLVAHMAWCSAHHASSQGLLAQFNQPSQWTGWKMFYTIPDDGHDVATKLRWSKECSSFWDRQWSRMYELACRLRWEWTKNVELFLANHSLENEACWEITTWIDMAPTFTCSATWAIFPPNLTTHLISPTLEVPGSHSFWEKTSISRWETLPPQPQPKWNHSKPWSPGTLPRFSLFPWKMYDLGRAL